MSICSGKWLVPPKPCARKSLCQKFIEMIPHPFHASYWRNNRPFLFFLFILAAANIILFIHRAYYFKDFSMLNGFTPNPFYLLSRACGKNILISFFLWRIYLNYQVLVYRDIRYKTKQTSFMRRKKKKSELILQIYIFKSAWSNFNLIRCG